MDTSDTFSRRRFIGSAGVGLSSIAASHLLQTDGLGADVRSHFPAKAKRVIWLFMNGGVSHMESFDPKPMLTRYGGQTIAETPYAAVQNPEKLKLERAMVPDANGQQRNVLFPLQAGFR